MGNAVNRSSGKESRASNQTEHLPEELDNDLKRLSRTLSTDDAVAAINDLATLHQLADASLVEILHEGWFEKEARGFRIGESWQRRFFVLYRHRAAASSMIRWTSSMCYFENDDPAAEPKKHVLMKHCVGLKHYQPAADLPAGSYFCFIPEDIKTNPWKLRLLPDPGSRLNSPAQSRKLQQLLAAGTQCITHENSVAMCFKQEVDALVEPNFEPENAPMPMQRVAVLFRELLDTLAYSESQSLRQYLNGQLENILQVDPSSPDFSPLMELPKMPNVDYEATCPVLGAEVVRYAKSVSAVVAMVASTLYSAPFDGAPDWVKGEMHRAWRDMQALQQHQLRLILEWIVYEDKMPLLVQWASAVPLIQAVQHKLDTSMEIARHATIELEMQDKSGWVTKLHKSDEQIFVPNANDDRGMRFQSARQTRNDADNQLQAIPDDAECRLSIEEEREKAEHTLKELTQEVTTEKLGGLLRPSLYYVTMMCLHGATPVHKVQLWSKAISSATTMINLQLARSEHDPIGGPQLPGVVLFVTAMSNGQQLYAHVLLGTLFTLFDGDLDKFQLPSGGFFLYPESDSNLVNQYVMDGEQRGIDPLHTWGFVTGALKLLIERCKNGDD